MALKETIQITVDDAGLKQLQTALRKTGQDVSTFNRFVKDQQMENRKTNFVLRESAQSVQTLSNMFGGSTGLNRTMNTAIGSFQGLDFAMASIQQSFSKTEGGLGKVIMAFGRIALPVAVAGAAIMAYMGFVKEVDEEHKNLSKTLLELKFDMGQIDFKTFLSGLSEDLGKLKEEAKNIGTEAGASFWEGYLISIPAELRSTFGTDFGLGAVADKYFKNQSTKNEIQQLERIRSSGKYLSIDPAQRSAMSELQDKLTKLATAITDQTTTEKEREKLTKEYIAIQKRLTSVESREKNILRVRELQVINLNLQADEAVIRAENQLRNAVPGTQGYADALANKALAERQRLGVFDREGANLEQITQNTVVDKLFNLRSNAQKEFLENERLSTESMQQQTKLKRLIQNNTNWINEISTWLSLSPELVKALQGEYGEYVTKFEANKFSEMLEKEKADAEKELVSAEKQGQMAISNRKKINERSNSTQQILLESMDASNRLATLELINKKQQLTNEKARQEQVVKEATEIYQRTQLGMWMNQHMPTSTKITTPFGVPAYIPGVMGEPAVADKSGKLVGPSFKEDYLRSATPTFWERLGFGEEDNTLKNETNALEESFMSAFDTLTYAGMDMWDKIFGEANSVLEQFVQTFLSSLTGQIINAGIGALLSLLPGGSLLNFITGNYHTGGYLTQPSTQDVPITARGGEMILTESQQARLFNMANGSTSGGGSPVNVTLHINAIDAKGVRDAFSKKDTQKQLMGAIANAVSSGRKSW